MTALNRQFTSTGHKFFLHQEAMNNLRNQQGTPVVSHIMLTDICQHKCAFCSVATRDGNSLTMQQLKEYLDQLVPLGLKAVILSGGGNPILYKDKEESTIGQHPMLPPRHANFNDAVDFIKSYGLEIGLITNGMPLKEYGWTIPIPSATEMLQPGTFPLFASGVRKSWLTVHPKTLDKLTWVRISMSGLDHKEGAVFVPDIDPSKTTLGFSYVLHDIYVDPQEPNHGKVSTPGDLVSAAPTRTILANERIPVLTEQIEYYVKAHKPVYVRLLPNCLEPLKIEERCVQLQEMAAQIDPNTVFVQYKPPQAPKRCFLGYIHPVLNTDGYVYPCDSCVLNSAAGHKFAGPWRVCRWDEIAAHYAKPVASLVDSQKLCPGCVFTQSNDVLARVVDGAETPMPPDTFTHPNFV